MGMTVEGPGNRKWSAKLSPEAPTEVVASRILWGLGYHQPPIYYVGRWNADGAPEPGPAAPRAIPRIETGSAWARQRRPLVVANRFIRRFKQKIEEGLALGR